MEYTKLGQGTSTLCLKLILGSSFSGQKLSHLSVCRAGLVMEISVEYLPVSGFVVIRVKRVDPLFSSHALAL